MKITQIHSSAMMVVALLAMGAAQARSQQPSRDDNVDLRRDTSRAATSQGMMGHGMTGHTMSNHTMTGSTALQPTAEMWFYEQERTRHEDPKAAVRRRAEYRAAQRENRIESLRWFGMSNSRPTVSVTPFTGSYGPTWAGNSLDWNIWRPVGPTVVVSPKSGY